MSAKISRLASCGICVAAIDDEAAGGGAALQQRIELSVLDDRIGDLRIAAAVLEADRLAADER